MFGWAEFIKLRHLMTKPYSTRYSYWVSLVWSHEWPMNQYMMLVPVCLVLVTWELWQSIDYCRGLNPQYPHVFSGVLGVRGAPSTSGLLWSVWFLPGNRAGDLTAPSWPSWQLVTTETEGNREAQTPHPELNKSSIHSIEGFLDLSYLIHLLIKCGDELMKEEERISGEECLILCFKAWGRGRHFYIDWALWTKTFI